MCSILAHLAIFAVLLSPIGSSRLLLVELGDDAEGEDRNSSIGLGMVSPMTLPRTKTTRGHPMKHLT